MLIPIPILVPFLLSWVYGVSDIPMVLGYSECLTIGRCLNLLR